MSLSLTSWFEFHNTSWISQNIEGGGQMPFNYDNEVDGYKGLMIICEPIMYLIWNVNMWVVKNLNSPFQSYCLILGWLKESEVISLDGGSQEIGLFFLNLSVGFQKSTIAKMNCAFRAELCYQVFLLYVFTILPYIMGFSKKCLEYYIRCDLAGPKICRVKNE